MTRISPDLTIDGVLADPVIGAVLRADHVDPRRLEALLRSTARSIEQAREPSALPLAALAGPARRIAAGTCLRW